MIHVYEQEFTEEDAQAAYDAVKSGILSHFGPNVAELEEKFTTFIGSKYGMTCSNGTAGLYVAMIGANLQNCRVAIPDCAYAAVASVPVHRGCRLEFIDVSLKDWNLDLNELEDKCQYWLDKDPIKAVIAVHTYGSPYDYDRLRSLSKKYSFIIIEDACEALYADYKGTKTGRLGDISVFSFYSNKLLAAGEGGMILTDNLNYFNLMKLYKSQGQDSNRKFWHLIPGFNYRMTNVQAAMVLSQFKRIDSIQSKKLKLKDEYLKWFPSHVSLQGHNDGTSHAYWMISILGNTDDYYEKTSQKLLSYNVETRPIFPSLHSMPAFYAPCHTPNTDLLNRRGISLPSGPGTKLEDVKMICKLL